MQQRLSTVHLQKTEPPQNFMVLTATTKQQVAVWVRARGLAGNKFRRNVNNRPSRHP
jgi:hypothetical protein